MVERQLPKLDTRVRFPSPAPFFLMRLTNSWFIPLLLSLSLGVIGCSSSSKKKPAAIPEEESAEMKAKAKRKKKEPVDQEYTPRGGFR